MFATFSNPNHICLSTAPGLLDHFVPLVVSDSSAREKAALHSQPPAPIISLYNHTLEHLATVATSEELGELNWPIPDFAGENFTEKSEPVYCIVCTFYWLYVSSGLPPVFWNDTSYLCEVGACIRGLQLPLAPRMGPNWTEADWHTQCTQCLDYITSLHLLPHSTNQHSVLLFSR